MRLSDLVRRYGDEKVISQFVTPPSPRDGDMLREQNFENLVLFFEEELRKIGEGERAFEVLSRYTVKSLVRKGILTMDYPKGRGKKHILTIETSKILEKIKR